MGLLFVEAEVEVEEEEICIPGIGWVGIFTKEARDYRRNRDELLITRFDTEGAIDAFLAANPDNLEVIPEGKKHYPSWTDKEWDSAIFERGI